MVLDIQRSRFRVTTPRAIIPSQQKVSSQVSLHSVESGWRIGSVAGHGPVHSPHSGEHEKSSGTTMDSDTDVKARSFTAIDVKAVSCEVSA